MEAYPKPVNQLEYTEYTIRDIYSAGFKQNGPQPLLLDNVFQVIGESFVYSLITQQQIAVPVKKFTNIQPICTASQLTKQLEQVNALMPRVVLFIGNGDALDKDFDAQSFREKVFTSTENRYRSRISEEQKKSENWL